MGLEVLIFSCRIAPVDIDHATPRADFDVERDVESIASKLAEDFGHELYEGRISIFRGNFKPNGVAYVDDKGIRFEDNWPEVVEQVREKVEPRDFDDASMMVESGEITLPDRPHNPDRFEAGSRFPLSVESIKETKDGLEVRVTDPDTGGQKGTKLQRFDLLPVLPLTKLAEHYGKGADKYEDRNWQRGYSWSLSYAALMRHLTAFWNGEDYDEETGSHHLDAVAFHTFALRYFAEYHQAGDDREETLRREEAIDGLVRSANELRQ